MLKISPVIVIPPPPVVPPKAKSAKAAVEATVPKGDLETIVAAIHKEKGTHVIVTGDQIPLVERLPTGLFEFDFFTGGGFPKGRFSIVYGPASSGKTNICLKAVARAQRRPAPRNKAVWVNIEQTFDKLWAMKMGVNTKELQIVNARYGEEAVDLIDALVRAEDLECLVVDSIAALISSKEIDQSAENFDVGTSALLIKRLCNKLMYAFEEESRRGHFPCVILINQTRIKIGQMFGDPEIMPGGETQKFLSSLRVRLYGRDEIVKAVNPNLSAFKDTNVIIKKAKVPILATSFQYKQCMYAHDGLEIGDTRSWNMVSNYLKQLGFMEKVAKGWSIAGEAFPLLADAQEVYEKNDVFRLDMQNLVIEAYKDQTVFVEEKGA